MKHRYPLGIQTFENLRNEGFIYIDKSEHVYNLTHDDSKFVFLSRPRRFGKSLLVSTLRSYFEGRRDLFEGLAIERLETEWRKYPVLHFNMSSGKYMDEGRLEQYLSFELAKWEKVYGTNPKAGTTETRMASLIERAYEQTGEQVVVLIDEYDAPLLDVVHEDTELPKLRKIMRNFYSPLKAADPYLRFVFLTGITKFSQLSIFSELNNIKNVSMLDKYAPICGITKEELLTQMSPDIDQLAEALEKSREETIEALRRQYDGYHFSGNCPDIFNPFSLLNCFSDKNLSSYWFGSGTPTYLIETMRKFGTDPSQIQHAEVVAEEFDAPTESMSSILPLLYQSGYVTIKRYDKQSGLYDLDIPNNEVRVGLMSTLAKNYLQSASSLSLVTRMGVVLRAGDIDKALTLMQQFFRTVPYCDNTDYEGHWQQMLYVVFSLFGAVADVEVHTADGRIDLALELSGRLYIIETKLNSTAEAALAQIDRKHYTSRFALSPLPLTKIGLNFNTGKENRGIDGWVIENC